MLPLSDVCRDIISIGGFLLTFAGLLYTIRQVWLAKTAAEAAKEAADQSLSESRKGFLRYIAANAHRYINEAKRSVESRQWTQAALRLNDLADQLAQLSTLSPSFKRQVAGVRKWEHKCSQLAAGGSEPLGIEKWKSFCVSLQKAIDKVHGPFAEGESSNDPQ